MYNEIVPVEVKSGTKGGMKSMNVFLDNHSNSTYGLKISQSIKQQNQRVQEITLYGLEGWLKP